MAFDDIARWEEMGGRRRVGELLAEVKGWTGESNNPLDEDCEPGIIYVNNCYELAVETTHTLEAMSYWTFVQFVRDDVFRLVCDVSGYVERWHFHQ